MKPVQDTLLKSLQKQTGLKFRKRKLLSEALTHSSVTGRPHYERLEFLGDSVLNLAVSKYLFLKHPDADEGRLTKLKSYIVSEQFLNVLAGKINLYKHIITGPEAADFNDDSVKRITADVFEALLGALFLDKGYSPAEKFILKLFRGRKFRVLENPKSRIQELLQKKRHLCPFYTVKETENIKGRTVFTVECRAGIKVLGKGSGNSKKEAEIAAARDALRRILRRSKIPRPAKQSVTPLFAKRGTK